MSWVTNKAKYEQIAREIDPAVKLTTKDAWPWKVMAALVMVFTFGGITYRRFLTEFATTIGPIQAYPREWAQLKPTTIIHESRHTRQCRWFGLWIHPWLGLPLFGVLYLLLPLPLGFAWFRWRFEIDADRAAYRWMLANNYLPAMVLSRAQSFGATVTGGSYGWSWLIKGVGGFEKAALEAIRDSGIESDLDSPN